MTSSFSCCGAGEIVLGSSLLLEEGYSTGLPPTLMAAKQIADWWMHGGARADLFF